MVTLTKRAWRAAVIGASSIAIVGCGLIAGFGDVPSLGDPNGEDGGADGTAPGDDGGARADGPITQGDGGGEASVTCSGAQVACGAACVDPQSDPKNCGACGHACGQGFSCASGVCGDAVVEMAAGAAHVCAKLQRGDVYCWGNNADGELGAGDAGGTSNVPVLVPRDQSQATFTNPRQLTAGHSHVCALKQDGTMMCWGSQYFGQLSDGVTTQDGGPVVDPLPHPALMSALGFGAGYRYRSLALGPMADHGCAATDEAGVVCWGDNESKQLWHDGGSIGNRQCNGTDCAPDPQPVSPLSNVTQVAVGAQYSCSVDDGGVAKCWGNNFDGQLGNGTHGIILFGDAGTPPTTVLIDAGVASIACGSVTTCAVTADGSVWCWGDNAIGQLGHDAGSSGDGCCQIEPGCTTMNFCSAVPSKVAGIGDVKSVAVGCSHACALKNDGTVWCWGDNSKGQLGIGSNDASAQPRKVSSLGDVVGLTLGCDSSCAWKKDGTAWCWGVNAAGQLANGIQNQSAPVPVQGLP